MRFIKYFQVRTTSQITRHYSFNLICISPSSTSVQHCVKCQHHYENYQETQLLLQRSIVYCIVLYCILFYLIICY